MTVPRLRVNLQRDSKLLVPQEARGRASGFHRRPVEGHPASEGSWHLAFVYSIMEECHAHCSARLRSSQLRPHRNNDFMSLFCNFRIKSCRGLLTSTIDCLGRQRDHNTNYKANFGKKPNTPKLCRNKTLKGSAFPYSMTYLISCCCRPALPSPWPP